MALVPARRHAAEGEARGGRAGGRGRSGERAGYERSKTRQIWREIVAAATGRREDRWRGEPTTVPELGMVGVCGSTSCVGRTDVESLVLDVIRPVSFFPAKYKLCLFVKLV